MSEELVQKGLDKHGIQIGRYEYYNTSRTNLNTFKKYKIIPKKNYGKYRRREPDGLLVDRSDKNNIRIILTIERKSTNEFRTEAQKIKATQQCNDLSQVLESIIGVITDSKSTIWINPRQSNKDNEYLDRTTGEKRSYSFIRNEDKKYLTEPFIIKEKVEDDIEKLDEETKNTLYYIEKILMYIDENNSDLKATDEVDPLRLAQAVWQDIYINTAKSPIKCLYNVVELFIFKFLSDLRILKQPNDFNSVFKLSLNDEQESLRYYAYISRRKILELFPSGSDKTTIINGTIFVDSNDNPVESQSLLFANSLKKFNEFVSLKNVKKEFKTKLFETFLKQSTEKNRLGQFFTPRKIVKAIVDMADVDKLTHGSKVCDPFCGVGGFILETIQNPTRLRDFYPTKTSDIKPKIEYFGYDKGSDEDDERIIILAKANMLIYLSSILEKHPNLTKKFADIFNNTFHFITESNLGTLGNRMPNTFDLILTNPPYITSGVSTIKNEINKSGLSDFYTANGKGVDGLALEWIIKSLKRGGRALVIIRDGILNSIQNKGLKTLIRNECYINGIISLPIKTFFNTPQKTYILIITKKTDFSIDQSFPIFTYLVSDIGETLDIYRFENEGKSDLQKSVELFNAYKGSPNSFPIDDIADLRCKLLDQKHFIPEKDWDVDRFWSSNEKEALGISEEDHIVSFDEFTDELEEVILKFKKVKTFLKSASSDKIIIGKTIEISISEIFDIDRGSAIYSHKYMRNNPGNYPVYSSQTINDGIIGKIDSFDHEKECLTWTTDGIYAGTIFHRNDKFSMTSHCGALFLKKKFKDKISLSYIQNFLQNRLRDYAIGVQNKRITLQIIKNVILQIPIDESGNFDIKRQTLLARKLEKIKKAQSNLGKYMEHFASKEIDIGL